MIDLLDAPAVGTWIVVWHRKRKRSHIKLNSNCVHFAGAQVPFSIFVLRILCSDTRRELPEPEARASCFCANAILRHSEEEQPYDSAGLGTTYNEYMRQFIELQLLAYTAREVVNSVTHTSTNITNAGGGSHRKYHSIAIYPNLFCLTLALPERCELFLCVCASGTRSFTSKHRSLVNECAARSRNVFYNLIVERITVCSAQHPMQASNVNTEYAPRHNDK